MALLTTFWIYDTLTLLFILIALLYYYTTKTFNYWAKKGVPFLKPVPIFGNFWPVLSFTRSPGQFLQDCYNSSTDKFCGLFIFRRPFLLIRDPDLIKAVLIRDFHHFNERCHADCSKTDPIGCDNLFNMRNPFWRAMRIKLTPVFSSGKLKIMFPLFKDVARNLNEYFQSRESEKLEMKNVCARYSTDVIASIAFGVEANSFKSSKTEFYQAALDITRFTYRRSVEFTSFFFAPLLVTMLNFKFFGAVATKLFETVFRSAMKHRRDTGFRRNDLVDLLMNINKQKNNLTKDAMISQYGYDLSSIEFGEKTLAAQSAVFFTAGFESGSSVMSLCLLHLSQNPDWQQRIQVEIEESLNENAGEFTYESLENMKFLNMCICETLRLYPTLPFIDRECSKEYTIPGTNIIIEKGTPILISLSGMHRDPSLFPNPTVFDPERWNQHNIHNVVPYSYLPFGEGPRNCIGKRFALIQIRIGLMYILKDFNILTDKKNQGEILLDPRGLLTTPLNPIQLTPKRINE